MERGNIERWDGYIWIDRIRIQVVFIVANFAFQLFMT
jgi:hypothetical protein